MDVNKAISEAVRYSIREALDGVDKELTRNVFLQAESLKNIEKYNANSLLNESQVSELTGIAVPTLRKWRNEKREIPYIRMGNSVRYKYSDLLDYIKANTVKVMQGGNVRGGDL